VRTGDYVKVGDLLAEMANLHNVRVRACVDEPELGGLQPNEPVKITRDALPNRVWKGTTEVIPKQVVARGTRSVGELLCAVSNDGLELLPNINVNVQINAQERRNALSIPRGAVETENGHRFVFLVKTNQLSVSQSQLEKREIQVGIADTTSYEVLRGLEESDLVAMPGDFELRDGMAVKVVNTDAAYVRGTR
jgi:HlyD family secretion protein